MAEQSKPEGLESQRQQRSAAASDRGEGRNANLMHRGEGPSQWSSPFALMRRMAEDMDRVFGRSFIPSLWGDSGTSMWSPEVEVFERGNQLVVRADLPGLKKEDVRINVEGDQLTISGERKQEHEEKREGFYRSERSYGQFYRSIPLPEGVNPDEAKANFTDGVLEVTMPAPKHKEQRGRQIEIQ